MQGMCINYLYSQDFEDIISQLYSFSQREYSEVELQDLQEKLNNPINLNSLNEEDCKQFIFLSDFEQKSLWNYIQYNKPLQSIYELQLVLGLPKEKAQILSKFCCVKPVIHMQTFDDLIKQGEHAVSLSMQIPKVNFDEYSNTNNFVGNPIKEVWRYRFQSNNSLYWGVTFKKDAGEQVSWRNESLFDFESAYLQVKDKGVFSNIVVGDYNVQIGQGLTLWQGGFFGKSIHPRNSQYICNVQKHSSSNEYEYSRGVATNIQWGDFYVTPFVSFRNLDGKAKEDSVDFPFQMYTTGYHRTQTELLNKNTIEYMLYGANVQYDFERWQFGLTALQHSLSFGSISKHMQNYSFAWTYNKNGCNFFGETAFDSQLKNATHLGFQALIGDDVDVLTTIRNYAGNYQSFMAKALSEQGEVKNEIGNYSQISFPLLSNVSIICNNDFFYMPQQRFFVKAPTRGNEFRVKFQYATFTKLTAYYQYIYESKTESKTSDAEVKQIENAIKQTHKFYISIPFHEKIQLKTAAFFATNSSFEKGYLIYQDIIYKPNSSLSVSFRYAQCDTPYDLRIYAWEDDVMYSFSGSQYYYESTQWFGIVKWKISSQLEFQTKVSSTQFSNLYPLPDSYNEFENSNKVQFHVFLQWKI